MRLELNDYNLLLIDFQDIHSTFDKDLLDQLHLFQITTNLEKNKDFYKILTHFTVKGTVDYLNSVKSNNKLILYFNNTQFYESEILNYIDETVYLTLITNILLKIRNILPIKIVISSKSLELFSHLLTIDDGRAKGTLIRIINTVNSFKVENFTFEKVKKFASKNGLNFLSGDYFNDMKTKQIAFK